MLSERAGRFGNGRYGIIRPNIATYFKLRIPYSTGSMCWPSLCSIAAGNWITSRRSASIRVVAANPQHPEAFVGPDIVSAPLT
jgi:hypothetical protein